MQFSFGSRLDGADLVLQFGFQISASQHCFKTGVGATTIHLAIACSVNMFKNKTTDLYPISAVYTDETFLDSR